MVGFPRLNLVLNYYNMFFLVPSKLVQQVSQIKFDIVWSIPSIAQDLLAKYHNNVNLVDELIKNKVASSAWKDHPEFPGNADSFFEITDSNMKATSSSTCHEKICGQIIIIFGVNQFCSGNATLSRVARGLCGVGTCPQHQYVSHPRCRGFVWLWGWSAISIGCRWFDGGSSQTKTETENKTIQSSRQECQSQVWRPTCQGST